MCERLYGWANIETYTVASLIDNDEDLYDRVRNIIEKYDDVPKAQAVSEIAECLKSIVTYNVQASIKTEEGFAKELLACALERVDFKNMAETWLNDHREWRNERKRCSGHTF